MAVKKQTVRKQLNSTEKFQTKAADGGDLFIEGWANRAVVDRGGEIIKKDAWRLDNYNKNPMMLFNHDKDKPIGKVVECQAVEGGLYVKARLSKSKDPMVSYVRDLVSEGILSTFSVGFDGQDEQKDQDGNIDIKQAELFEVSIVTLPMNQDSTFGVTMKSLEGAKNIGQARGIALRAKGAMVAASIQEGMHDAIAGGKTRDEILQRAAEISNLSVDDIKKVLVGDVTPVPEGLLYAFSEALGIKLDMLKKLNAGDAENEGGQTSPSDSESGSETEVEIEGSNNAEGEKGGNAENKPNACATSEKKGDGTDAGNKPPADAPPGDKNPPAPPADTKAENGIVSLHIPKTAVDSADAASKWAEDNGYVGGVVDETDSEYVLSQGNPDDFEGEGKKVDVGDGVYVMVAPKKPAAPKTEAEKQGDCQDKNDKNKVPTSKKDGAPPAAEGQGNGIPGNAAQDRPVNDPHMDLMKQTNVLLSSLVEEVKKMNAGLAGLIKQNTQQVTQTPPPDAGMNAAAEEQKAVDELTKELESKIADLNIRIKALKEADV